MIKCSMWNKLLRVIEMKNILYIKLIRLKSKDIVYRNKNIKDKFMSILENKLIIVKGGLVVGKSIFIFSYIGE